MIINHNISALNAQRVQGLNEASADKGMERLSSGQRINRGADDAAGLAISEKMRAQISGLSQASRNIQDGVSFIQATDGFLEETTNVLQRLRILAVQSANGIYQQEDRDQTQVEVDQLVAEIDRVAAQSQFNGMNPIDGTFGGGQVAAAAAPAPADGEAAPAPAQVVGDGGLIIHMGANVDQRASIYIGDMAADALGVQGLDLSNIEAANTAIGTVDAALNIVNKQRADLGAYNNRLTEARIGTDIAVENLGAAESRIRNANMAAQVVDFTRDQIKSQVATAMLAQANQRPQQVLQLLR